jgi:plasmid stability protein
MEKVNISVRDLPLEVQEALRDKAGAEDLSVNALIVQILTQSVGGEVGNG